MVQAYYKKEWTLLGEKWMNYQAEGAKSRDKPKNWENEAAEKHSQNNNYARKTLQTVKTRGS